jgi:hypothetical protein
VSIRRLVAGVLVAALLIPVIPAQAAGRRIRCESGRSGRYRECPVDTDGRVSLVRELSRHRCERGRSWGYDRRGIWVDDGCRAEFEVGNDGVSTGAAVVGIIVGAAILAAILADKDKGSDRRDNIMEAPEWMEGRFRGFSPKEDVAYEIEIERDGTVTGTANDHSLRGYIATGSRLRLGGAEFRVSREKWGFSAIHQNDPDNVIYFRRQ